jgi:hypothetical protein
VKTAFKTPFGLFEYKVMPFGLTNAPSVFMTAMNDILQGLSFVFVYLDDTLIFSISPEEHISHEETVLKKIKEHGFFLKLSKFDFFQTSITYLGHLINTDGVMLCYTDPKKLSAVKDWPTPKRILDVRSFLGLANYFRRYVHDFNKITVPLINLTKGNVSKRQSSTGWIVWTKECQQSFDTLRTALINAPALMIPDFNLPFEVITYASHYALGAILIQQGKPVAYESCILNSADRNYHTTDNNC